jgi:hypothetical protein
MQEVGQVSGATRTEVIWTYAEALKLVWHVGIAFCGAGFLVVFLEKEMKLRTELETEFSLADKREKPFQAV